MIQRLKHAAIRRDRQASGSRILVLSLMAVALLVAGVVVGHPSMATSVTCTGWYAYECVDLQDCRSFCQSTWGGVCDGDLCQATPSGKNRCHCDLQDPPK